MEAKQIKVAVVIVDRANYGRLLPVIEGLEQDPRFQLQLVLGGSFVLDRFGFAYKMVERDGLAHVPTERVYHEVEGNCRQSATQSIGLGVCGYAAALERLQPDYVVVIGDRYEAMAAAVAATYTGRPLVHFQGGEVSGTQDEITRHAITKLADYHVPATRQAAHNLVHSLGERPDSILTIGCPASDLARQVGHGPRPGDYMVVMFHPDGPWPGRQFDTLLRACYRFSDQYRLKVWWPNIDPDSDQISRKLLNLRRRLQFDILKHYHPKNFLRLLRGAAVCVGNSSSFVRDAGLFGTRAVIVGGRQDGRERSENCTSAPVNEQAIAEAITVALHRGPANPSQLYGDGHVTERFLAALRTARPWRRKQLWVAPRETSTKRERSYYEFIKQWHDYHKPADHPRPNAA